MKGWYKELVKLKFKNINSINMLRELTKNGLADLSTAFITH